METNKTQTLENETFKTLNKINLSQYARSKMQLKYLPWAKVWETLINYCPDATWTIYTRNVSMIETTTQEDPENHIKKTVTSTYSQDLPYFSDGRSCFVKVGVTIKGIEYLEYYPITGLKNEALRANSVTMVDVNKAIQRAFVKVAARHGIGLYLFQGEDSPEEEVRKIGESNDFEDVKEDVIQLIKHPVNQQVSDEIGRYIKETFSKKISQTTTEDLDKLIAARKYLMEINHE